MSGWGCTRSNMEASIVGSLAVAGKETPDGRREERTWKKPVIVVCARRGVRRPVLGPNGARQRLPEFAS